MDGDIYIFYRKTIPSFPHTGYFWETKNQLGHDEVILCFKKRFLDIQERDGSPSELIDVDTHPENTNRIKKKLICFQKRCSSTTVYKI